MRLSRYIITRPGHERVVPSRPGQRGHTITAEDRLVGVPILIVGLCLLRFNHPLGDLTRQTPFGPPWVMDSKGWLIFGRVIVIVIGAGWTFLGIGLLIGFLHH